MDGAIGEDSLHALMQDHGALPDTVEALTGGGGRHILFQHPGRAIRNSAGRLGPGLDIRADGGYIVAAPSVHPSGHAYEWEASSLPGQVPLASMPEWLLALLCEPQRVHVNGVDHVEQGGRNAHLASVAGTMRRRGMSAVEIEAALLIENAEHCRPPLPDDEVRRIAASISRYEPHASTSSDSAVKVLDSDLANATRLALRHGADLRYTPERGWLVWDGCRWCVDDAGRVMTSAKVAVREIFNELAPLKDAEQKALFTWARRSQSADRLRAMLFLTQSEPGIPSKLETFDADPLLLNCTNGTVCLRAPASCVRTPAAITPAA